MIRVTLEYQRDESTALSSGRICRQAGIEPAQVCIRFAGYAFRRMLSTLARVVAETPLDVPLSIGLQRTDRTGLIAYLLDNKTVDLFRTDPVAALEAMDPVVQSPSGAVRRVQRERIMQALPIAVGHDVLANAFGDAVYFRVRAHELECPGCGFWGTFASPGLAAQDSHAGAVLKTIFVCPKKCHERFVVTCMDRWGYVDVTYLLERTTLPAFFFPRAWNAGRPWITREGLEQKFTEYKKEKEQIKWPQKA